MSAADKLDVGQYWHSKQNNWLTYVVTGLTQDGWVRYTPVHASDPNWPAAAQYARSVDDFLKKYVLTDKKEQDEPPF